MTSTNQTLQRTSTSDSLSLLAASVRKPMTTIEDTGFASFLADTAVSDQTTEARRSDARAADSRNDRNDTNTRAQNERANDSKSDDTAKTEASRPTSVSTTEPVPVETQPASTTAQTYQHDDSTATADASGETAPAAMPAKQAGEKPATPTDKNAVESDAVTTQATEVLTTEPAIIVAAKTATKKTDIANKDALPAATDAPLTDDGSDAIALVDVMAPLAPPKSTTDKSGTLTLDTKSAQAPATAPELPALQAAADAAADAAGNDMTSDAPLTDGADLTGAGGNPIKSLGHETAKAMADSKGEARDAAKADLAQAAIAPVQASAQTARNVTPVTMASTEIEGVTATSTSAGGNNALMAAPSGTNATGSATTIRIGTLPGQTTPTQVPAMAIALQMSKNLQKGSSSFEIRLDPAEMGRIDVRMEVRQDGHITAHMTVDRPETLDLLQRDQRALQQALNDAGLQADADSLNFSLRDQNAGSNGGNGMADNSANYGGGMSDKADTPVIATPLYNINLSANGGVDIRI